MNPITNTTINPHKKYWPSRGSNQLPPVLKSCTLQPELWGSALPTYRLIHKVELSLNIHEIWRYRKVPAYVNLPKQLRLCPGGSVVSLSNSWPGGCQFDSWLRRTFFPAYFCLSPQQKHVGKVVSGFGKTVALILVWESQETHVTDHHMTLAVKVALNPNTTNQAAPTAQDDVGQNFLQIN